MRWDPGTTPSSPLWKSGTMSTRAGRVGSVRWTISTSSPPRGSTAAPSPSARAPSRTPAPPCTPCGSSPDPLPAASPSVPPQSAPTSASGTTSLRPTTPWGRAGITWIGGAARRTRMGVRVCSPRSAPVYPSAPTAPGRDCSWRG